jgi:hypothetical protein
MSHKYMAETSSLARYGNRKHEKGKHTNNEVVDVGFIMCEQNGLCPVTNSLQKNCAGRRITGLLKDVLSM